MGFPASQNFKIDCVISNSSKAFLWGFIITRIYGHTCTISEISDDHYFFWKFYDYLCLLNISIGCFRSFLSPQFEGNLMVWCNIYKDDMIFYCQKINNQVNELTKKNTSILYWLIIYDQCHFGGNLWIMKIVVIVYMYLVK